MTRSTFAAPSGVAAIRALSVCSLVFASALLAAPAAAQNDTLTVVNNNVGIRTDNPRNMFHISGGANEDVFAGVGLNPISGPAFNFGYAGGSFGRSAGFFNVRPDNSASAPNPSLRFFTANNPAMIIDNQGYLGISSDSSFNPAFPIHLASGAHVTTGGTWVNASSRALKTGIESLSVGEALETAMRLQPVTFAYKANPEDVHVGFIAEDVPSLVAEPSRQGLSAMDVVAVLTRVVQEQQRRIDELAERLEEVSGE
ncbi:MAG: tail fiber domain-containing protein [Acidobacteriota bacterium]